jgi:segregation and condensation protein B
MKIENLMEAILFHKAESMRIKELAKLLDVKNEEVAVGIDKLRENLTGRGIVLVTKDDEVMLRTSPETSEIIEKITKEDLSRDLGKAGLETLSIVLYNSPISGKEIEYIRGVKSSYILRSLLTRGLVERVPNPDNSRSFLYRPTFDTLGFLGISDITELPEYTKTKEQMDSFASKKDTEENENQK